MKKKTKPSAYDRLWTPKRRAAFQAAWEAFGSERDTIYARLFIDLRPRLIDTGEAKKRAVVEAGKRWSELTELPPLCTAEAWKVTCTTVGIAPDADFDIARDAIIVWALALQAERKRRAPATGGERWSKPDSPEEWATIFKCDPRTFVRWYKKGKIRIKRISTRAYMVHLNDMPTLNRQST